MLRRALVVLVSAGFLTVACEDGTDPDGLGGIAIQITLEEASDQSQGAGAAGADEPRPQFDVMTHLTGARAIIDGPTDRTIDLSQSGTGFSETVTGLTPGSYSVTVLGLVGSEVDYFGARTGITVTGGINANANITFRDFSPALADLPGPTSSLTFEVKWSRVMDATGYTVQYSLSPTFTTVASKAATDTFTTITVSGTGTWHVRVHASNALVQSGRSSDAKVIDVVTLAFGGTLSRTSGGFGDSLRIRRASNITWDADEFVTLGRKTRAWIQRRTADSLYVLIPNRPLSATDTVWVRNQGSGQLMQAAQFQITSKFTPNADPLTAPAITALPYGRFISLSDTTEDHYLTVTSNLPQGLTALITWQDTTDLTRGDTVDLDIYWTDTGFATWRGNWNGAVRNIVEISTVAMPPNNTWLLWLNKWTGTGGVTDSAEVMAALIVADTAVYQGVGTGYRHTCGLKTRGNAFCWGWNGVGQLGTGDRIATDQPVPVTGGITFRRVAASEFGSVSCGVASDSTGYCWGSNQSGQLGNPAFTDTAYASPIAVSGGHKFTFISPGVQHACGQTVAGAIYCWGDNTSGQLGDGSFTSSATPVQIASGATFRWVDAGGFHTCAVTTTAEAYCWGFDDFGRLGDGSATPAPVGTPTLVAGGISFRSVSGGAFHSCGVATDDLLYCWGFNADGQLGIGSTDGSIHSTPLQVTDVPTVQLVSGGAFHTCAQTYDPSFNDLSLRTQYCWGFNGSGQLGVVTGETCTDGTNTWPCSTTPAEITDDTYTSPHAGRVHTCAVSLSAQLQCWGENEDGQLGDGTVTDRDAPTTVFGQSPAAATTFAAPRADLKVRPLPTRSPVLQSSARQTRRTGFGFAFPVPSVAAAAVAPSGPVAELTAVGIGPRSGTAPRR